MNEQKAPAGIEWTRIRNADGTVRRGFTWNPVSGCKHDCEWVMPDGQRAECYAKTIAEKFPSIYPRGFSAYYWNPQRLSEPEKMKEPAGIFPDSMADLFGHWVDDDHLAQVLDVMRRTPQHIYQSLTKNTVAYRQHNNLPTNLWAGISSPADHFLGNELSANQKARYMHVALETLSCIAERRQIAWMSFEPLSLDYSQIVREYPGAIKWAVIGAASRGRTYYPPEEQHVRNLLDVLDEQGVPVFFKGNLRSLPYARDHWREDFPLFERVTE